MRRYYVRDFVICFFHILNPPELNKNYPIRPEVATTLELFESFVVILNMKKANDEVTHIISSHSINIICLMLTLFSTNLCHANENTAFKNSYKSTIIISYGNNK